MVSGTYWLKISPFFLTEKKMKDKDIEIRTVSLWHNSQGFHIIRLREV